MLLQACFFICYSTQLIDVFFVMVMHPCVFRFLFACNPFSNLFCHYLSILFFNYGLFTAQT